MRTIHEPILMADLSYKIARNLKVGDKVLGFTEDVKNIKFVESTVTHAKPINFISPLREQYLKLLKDPEFIEDLKRHNLPVKEEEQDA